MLEHFVDLGKEEKEELHNAISWITVYIAGADDVIDIKEISWAEKLSNIRAYTLSDEMSDYYQKVGENFQQKVESLINSLPKDTDERQSILRDHLASLDPILDKLPEEAAADIYESFRSFAKHVAKASGGFLGFFSISKDEKKILDLEMLTPRKHAED